MPVFIGDCSYAAWSATASWRGSSRPRWLTGFYLRVALRGAIGGLFVAVCAPLLFPAVWGSPILLVVTPGVILCNLWFDCWILRALTRQVAHRGGGAAPIRAGMLLACMGPVVDGGFRHWAALIQGQWKERSAAVLLNRNFYGALSVTNYHVSYLREFAHGDIIHGKQYFAPDKRRIPLTYFAPNTGVGLLMQDLERR